MPDVVIEDVDFSFEVDGQSKALRGVIGVPEGSGPWPGVVVLHEVFGIDEEMRKQVAHLARLGYLALMPDLFSDGGFRRCISATMRALGSGQGRAYADIESARQTLLADPRCTGSVGVIGFCMGGGFALMTVGTGFDAASVNYGMMPKDLDDALENACPIVTSYGAKDRTLRGATATLEEALTRKGIPHDSKEYPNAGHVFMNETLNGPAVIRPLVRIMNFGPEPESAKDAWGRVEAFFGEHLKK
jgi:carboxymethylenebutenolidase